MPASEIVYTISPSDDSAIAIEIFKTGLLRRRKHLIFFESFEGRLHYVADHGECSHVNLCVQSGSVVCRDAWLKPRKQQAVRRYAMEQALSAAGHPEIRFTSTQILAKRLRGFAVQGVLDIGNVSRAVKVNVAVTEKSHDRLQIEGDGTLRLSDFGIKPPKTLFGLAGTRDEVLIRFLLWGTPAAPGR